MGTITLPSTDSTRFCRFCLSEINLLTVIGPDAVQQEKHLELLRLVESHLRLNLEGTKDFPCAVCEMCITKLRDFDVLYRNAQEYSCALRVLLEEKASPNDIFLVQPSAMEPTFIEIYEPASVEDIDKDIILDDGLLISSIEDQIIPEDVPQHDEREERIDVYHVDGQLQRIVMEGGTSIDMQSEVSPTARGNSANICLNSTASQPALRKRILPPNATSRPRFPRKGTSRASNALAEPERVTRTVQPSRSKQCEDISQLNSKQLFRCKLCSNLFVELANYQSHTCSKLNREVVSNSRLPTSALVTDGQRLQCKMCNMTFRSKLLYQKHEYEVHGIRNENFGLECKVCGKLFSQRQDYQLHVQVMHPQYGVNLVKINK